MIAQTPPWPTRKKFRAILSSIIIQARVWKLNRNVFQDEELKTTLTVSDFHSKDNCPQGVHK